MMRQTSDDTGCTRRSAAAGGGAGGGAGAGAF